uniref:Glutamine amidotransferase domain-containing protein n=2 Tax=Rhodosorus marinus TaxID=101924 RepID=A0A7S2ZNL7_9RHOD|mmetsp:Transcript_26503/g.103267  ORF Transcript_26503/g.103267 Transcript_26503/m.103267 type:complete len:260 (+) Transcript_26503:302-1081(+)
MGSLGGSKFLVVDALGWTDAKDDLFATALSRIDPLDAGETYEVVKPKAGERVPETLEEVQQYDGIVISGSATSANDELEWIDKLSEMIKVIASQDKTRLVGICFGHQLVAKALGGSVLKQDKFILQPERIEPSSTLWTANVSDASQLLLESHGDQVSLAPPGAEVLASSTTAEIESMAVRSVKGDRRVVAWTLQAHPEMPAHLLVDRVLSRVANQVEDGGQRAREQLLAFNANDAKFMMKAVKTFLVSGWSNSDHVSTS